jgi:hypothetical protein
VINRAFPPCLVWLWCGVLWPGIVFWEPNTHTISYEHHPLFQRPQPPPPAIVDLACCSKTMSLHDQDSLLPVSHDASHAGVHTINHSSCPSCPSCPTTKSKLRHAMEGALVTCSSLLMYEVFHNPMCGLVFQCGCTFNPWLGGTGWNLCNVHNPNPTAPRCPWCISPRDTPAWTWTTSRTVIVGMMVASWAVVGWKVQRQREQEQLSKTAPATPIVATKQGKYQCIKRAASPIKRWIAPLAWFFWHHAIVGLIFGLATGYPYWFFITFPNRQKHSAPLAPVLPNATQHY